MFLISITVLSRAAIGKELMSQLRTAAPHAQMQMPMTRKRGDETTRDKRRGTDTQRDNSTQTHMWKKFVATKLCEIEMKGIIKYLQVETESNK